MLILSRVCADFHDSHGHLLFSVTPATRNTFINAPDAIREDPLFDLLCTDGKRVCKSEHSHSLCCPVL